MDSTNAKTDAGAIADALKDLFRTEKLDIIRGTSDAAEVLVLPVGRQAQSIKKFLDEYLPKPERREGTVSATTLNSFIDLVNRFATHGSVVFADANPEAPKITAVFDYHPANALDAEKLLTDWRRHRAIYAPALDEDWQAWLANDGEYLSQEDFAHFIEEHMTQLVVANLDDPTLKLYSELSQGSFAAPVDMIRLSRGIEISASIAVKQVTRLMSGEISMQYTETHSDGAGEPVKIPSLFQINVPVFEAGDHVRVIARLRYRRDGTILKWGYQLVEPNKAFKGAIVDMVDQIDNATEATVYFGAPEAAA